jgi:short-subunit dehydrogenase
MDVSYQSTYSATKFAIRGFSAALRMELAGRSIGVTTVMPGVVATQLLETARTYDTRASGRLAKLMLSHGLQPARLAERVVRAIRRNEAELSFAYRLRRRGGRDT